MVHFPKRPRVKGILQKMKISKTFRHFQSFYVLFKSKRAQNPIMLSHKPITKLIIEK